MDETTLRGILQSDIKLWEGAGARMEGDVLIKSIELPHGIGQYEVGFKGADNAGGRATAMQQWAGAIRGAVEHAVGDAAVTARAESIAPRPVAGPDSDTIITEVDRARTRKVVEEETVPAHEEFFVPSTETIDIQIDDTRERIAATKKALVRDERELRALLAYKEMLDGDQTEEVTTDPAGTS